MVNKIEQQNTDNTREEGASLSCWLQVTLQWVRFCWTEGDTPCNAFPKLLLPVLAEWLQHLALPWRSQARTTELRRVINCFLPFWLGAGAVQRWCKQGLHPNACLTDSLVQCLLNSLSWTGPVAWQLLEAAVHCSWLWGCSQEKAANDFQSGQGSCVEGAEKGLVRH